MKQLEGEDKRSVAQKARKARELKTISEFADQNFVAAKKLRTLGPDRFRKLFGKSLLTAADKSCRSTCGVRSSGVSHFSSVDDCLVGDPS